MGQLPVPSTMLKLYDKNDPDHMYMNFCTYDQDHRFI